MSSRKRQRTGSTPRPISKSLRLINLVGLEVDGSEHDLLTADFPCTVVGIRWDLSTNIHNTMIPGADHYLNWIIVVVKEGNTLNQMVNGTGQNNNIYNPQQNVLAFGTTIMAGSEESSARTWVGGTKTMRKLQTGDKLVFAANIGTTTNAVSQAIFGAVQFFCKT